MSNAGPDAATDVEVTDQLPTGLTFVSSSSSQGAYDPGTGIWTVGSLAAGATGTLSIAARVDTAGTKANTAQVTAADQVDPDSTPGNNVAGEDDQDSVIVTPPIIDLSLTKQVDNTSPNVGDTVTFTVTVSNAGPDAATGVVVTDQVPAGLSILSSTPSQGAYSNATGVWAVGTLGSGETGSLTITAQVVAAGLKTNTAEVTAADQSDIDSTPGNNVAAEDDQASVTFTTTAADLSLTKTVSNAAPNLGENVTFTVVLSNAGPDAATGVQVKDILPIGLTLVSATPSTGSYNSATGIWTVGSLANAASATLQIVASVDSSGSITNTAEVIASDQFDPDSTPGNNVPSEDDQASVTFSTSTAADLALTKTVNNAAPNVGDDVVFTVTLNNAGPSDATKILVSDILPAGLTFVSATPSPSYNPVTGIWTVGSLAVGATATFNITAKVDTIGAKTNTAQVVAVDQPDPDSIPNNNAPGEDDQDSVSINQPISGIIVQPTSGLITTEAGGAASFEVVLRSQPTDDVTIALSSSDPTRRHDLRVEFDFHCSELEHSADGDCDRSGRRHG